MEIESLGFGWQGETMRKNFPILSTVYQTRVEAVARFLK
jgi:hypothetical protein